MSVVLDWQSYPEPGGPLEWTKMPSDSQVFGFPIYVLRCTKPSPDELRGLLKDALARFAQTRPAMLHTRIESTDVPRSIVLAEAGFYPVEALLEIDLALRNFRPVFPAGSTTRIRPAVAEDLPRLKQIAGSAFTVDRQHLDPHLPKERTDFRHEVWIENAFRAGEKILVYDDLTSGRLIGFFNFLEEADGLVDMNLAAIDPDYQRSGVGARMFQDAMLDCQKRGYRRAASRISVNNFMILNLAMPLGFRIRRALLTFHWFAG